MDGPDRKSILLEKAAGTRGPEAAGPSCEKKHGGLETEVRDVDTSELSQSRQVPFMQERRTAGLK